jgi:phage baseplate assembly protein W
MDVAVDGKAFLGTGWAFPVALGASGVALVKHEEDVRQSLLILLRTNPGERVMRPGFGAGLQAFMFEPINSATMHALARQVEQTLIEFEPRIDQIGVVVRPDEEYPGRLLIDIEYRIRATNATGNLVYPFYLREGLQ